MFCLQFEVLVITPTAVATSHLYLIEKWMVAFNVHPKVQELIRIVNVTLGYTDLQIELALHVQLIPEVIFFRMKQTFQWFLFQSTGIYPNCECTESEKVFSAYINQCYIECGDDSSTGLHPECICDDKNSYYDVDTKNCKSIVGRTCPEDSIGIGPDCLCMNERHVFMVSLWECDSEYFGMPYIPDSECPDSSQRWPQCSVSIDQKLLTTLIGWGDTRTISRRTIICHSQRW